MFGHEIEDYKQLREVKKKLDENLGRKLFFKSLSYCGVKIVPTANLDAVAVVANNKSAKIHGVAHCKSSWCCPVCTSKQMAKYAGDIAVAIDALKEKDQLAAMITFTVPHTSDFSCEEVTEILYNTWKGFTVHGNKIHKSSPNDIFANFAVAMNHKHRIRVCEYTWGNAGWHPHFHTLFWFPKENFQKILDWEDRLLKRWLELCQRYTIRQLLKRYPETERKTVKAKVTSRVKIMYSKLNEGSSAVFISKDKQNKVIVQQSSNYICGWGANRELTANVQYKASNPNHLTWQQILDNAIATDHNEPLPHNFTQQRKSALDVAQVPAEAKQIDWWELYFEYATATRKYRHARINYSVHSGIKQIIADYKKSNAYKKFSKKNCSEKLQKFGRWRVVCWFRPSLWYEICSKMLEPEILELAVKGGIDEINRFLKAQGFTESALQNIGGRTEILEEVLNAA